MPGRAWATPPSRRASTQRSGSRRRRTCTTTSTPCSPRTSRCGTRSASCTPAALLQVKVAWPGALCPGWLAAARAAARRISSAPACLGLPSAPDRSPPLPRLDAEDALRRHSAEGGILLPCPRPRLVSLSPEIRTRPLCRPPCRPRALLCDRAEAAASGGGAQRAAAQLCRPRVVPWHLPRATGGLLRGGSSGPGCVP